MDNEVCFVICPILRNNSNSIGAKWRNITSILKRLNLTILNPLPHNTAFRCTKDI